MPLEGARFGQNPGETSLSSPKAATPKPRENRQKGGERSVQLAFLPILCISSG
ncbi:MAG: hypothetical protein RXQ95_08905 [Vulcanisaeta sp.]